MAILGGLPSLVAVYSYNPGGPKNTAQRACLTSALFLSVVCTLRAYLEFRLPLYQLSGIAPVILYLGLVPLWLQLAFVA